MRWPWSKTRTEKRQNQPLAGHVGDQFFNLAANNAEAGDPAGLAALEVAAAMYSSVFSAAKITPDNSRTRALSPSVMGLIARNLIRRGEDAHLIEVIRDRVVLRPVGFWYVRGGPNSETWFYNLYRYGASESANDDVPASQVLHAKYAVHSSRPWLGVAPLQWAARTSTLSANLEQRLGEEAGGPVGWLIPIPEVEAAEGGEDDAATDPLAKLAGDVANLKGKTRLVPTTASGFGGDRIDAPRLDWKAQRIGGAPPDTSVSLRSDTSLSVLAACNVPVSLATDADGTSQRESWRRFILGSVEPLLATLAEEIEAKLDVRVTFDLRQLWAHDLVGRSSAFKRLVEGGMALDQAVASSGLMIED